MTCVAILMEILNKKNTHPNVIPTIEPVSKAPVIICIHTIYRAGVILLIKIYFM